MSDFDDHVIPYEEAVRRHRALQEQRRRGVVHEVKISDAMNHLLHDESTEDEEGPKPAQLREIVAREFSDEEAGGEGDASGEPEPAFCNLEERPDQPPR